MLKRLFIQNLATIKKQIVEFQTGFTALTGETGAGKSVLIKALQLILGEKCPKDLIRANETFLSVEGVFDIASVPPILQLLDAMDIEHEGELTIRRKVHVSGKNSIFINDHSVNLSNLAQFSEHLIDLHGQHSQQSLLSPAFHVDFLDAFAGLQERVSEFGRQVQQLQLHRKRQGELQTHASDRNREIDFLRFQIAEIEEADFSTEEEASLYEEANRLAHAEKLIESLTPIADWNAGDLSPLSTISGCLTYLKDAVKIDPQLESFSKEIESGLIILEEASSEITNYLSRIELNPHRLEEVNKRLADLDSLKRKYGPTLEEIEHYRSEQEKKLETLENEEFDGGRLEKMIAEMTQTLLQEAADISEQRHAVKTDFEKMITDTLKELGMEQARFELKLEPFQPRSEQDLTFNAKGIDKVEFIIATNPGTPLRPLAKIASGGELSRIMLAIKTALNFDVSHGSMVFDEVDAGISGRVAETVGEKLLNLGQSRQIICITHSPQIAANASEHFKVEKIVEDDMSSTLIHKLDPARRIDEIAQFLGGNEITDKIRSVAAEMLTAKN